MRLVESGKLGPVLAGLIAENAGNAARVIELCLVIPAIAPHVRDGSKMVGQTLAAWAGSAHNVDRHVLAAERALKEVGKSPQEKFHECFARAVLDHSADIEDAGFVTIFAELAGSIAEFVSHDDRAALFIFLEQEAADRHIHADEKPELAVKMIAPLLRLIVPDIENDPAIISQALPTITANLRLPLEEVVGCFHKIVNPEILNKLVA